MRKKHTLQNPLKLSSQLACYYPALSSILCLRHETNNRLPQNKIFVLCSFHMLYTTFIMEYIYLENLHFNSMAILVVTFAGSLAPSFSFVGLLFICFSAVYLFRSPIFRLWMGFVHSVCVRARVLYALRLEKRAMRWLALIRSLCECEKPVFDLIKFILKFVAHRFRKQYWL